MLFEKYFSAIAKLGLDENSSIVKKHLNKEEQIQRRTQEINELQKKLTNEKRTLPKQTRDNEESFKQALANELFKKEI